MMRFQSPPLKDESWRDLALDFTPMVDILFILLVFFMLTMGTALPSFHLTLPSPMTEGTIPDYEHPIVLEIHPQGYVLDATEMAQWDQLTRAIPEIVKNKPEYKWLIASDRHIPIERVLQVLVYLRSQGIETAPILMRDKENP